MKAKIIVAVMALFLTVGLSAQTPQKAKNENRKSCYVDKNNNGVCDKHEDGTCKVGNGKGLQDGSGKGQGLRDGSGRKNGKGKGQACGKRDGSGRNNGGKGNNFVDKNNNGVCDNRETVDKK